ncbi:uncharacterized protein [Diabrotica undecimpunctata]|uniref:uncharacterized protein n=1 Tax=Diabrotica undecimpunctata TaxID=50387 RepID=UPI003B638ABF
MKHVKGRRIIQEDQFVFRKGRNCELQLARVISDTKIRFSRRQKTGMAILDIEKAYDMVWKKALIYKMNRARLPCYLVNICDTYLPTRTLFEVSRNQKPFQEFLSGRWNHHHQ